jgi:hypothetical protein
MNNSALQFHVPYIVMQSCETGEPELALWDARN